MNCLRFLVVLIICLLTFQAQGQVSSSSSSTGTSGPLNPSSGLPPVINRISGCIDQGTVTVDCPRPTVLTLHGSGFMTGLEYEKYPFAYLNAVLELPDVTPAVQCSLSYQVFNDTVLICTIFDRGYGGLPTGQMIPIIINNLRTKDQTPPFAGFSLKFEPAPVVTGVTGCKTNSPDSRTTYNCDLIGDSITLLGSGFTSIDRTSVKLEFGSSSGFLFLGSVNPPIVRYSDTESVMPFATSYWMVAEIDLQDEKPILLRLRDLDQLKPKWTVDPVWVQFADLPRPEITGLTDFGFGQGCIFDNTTNRYIDCIAGLSTLSVQGRYFLQGSFVQVGGQRADSNYLGSSNLIYFTLPVFEYTNGIYYDVSVTTLGGTATLAGVIEFSTDPVVTGIIPCVDDGNGAIAGYEYGRCMPGETLRLNTLNIRTTAAPRVYFLNWYGNRSLDSECLNPVTVDKRTITCTMPDPPVTSQAWQLGQTTVYVGWASGEKSNQILVNSLWEPKDSPRLTSLTGCYSDSGNPLWANQCVGQPDTPIVLTLSGVRFAGHNWTVSSNGWVTCERPVTVSAEMITCVLSPISEYVGYGQKYSIFLLDVSTGTLLMSNAGYITYVDHVIYASTSSSSSANATTIALATVFSVVGAGLLVTAIVLIRRRLGYSKSSTSTETEREFSTTGTNHVELSEV